MDFQKLWNKILYISENPVWVYDLFIIELNPNDRGSMSI